MAVAEAVLAAATAAGVNIVIHASQHSIYAEQSTFPIFYRLLKIQCSWLP
jgi:hypothetical protein